MEKLNDLYAKGDCTFPNPGRYKVRMCIGGRWETVLEKRIKNNKGTNHLPIFGLRWFPISFMNFRIIKSLESNELLFVYENKVLIDNLRHISYGNWLGQIFYKDKFIDWFFLVKI